MKIVLAMLPWMLFLVASMCRGDSFSDDTLPASRCLQDLFVKDIFIVCNASKYYERANIAESFESHKSYVSFLQDGKNLFVIKQVMDTDDGKLWYSVREMFAGAIAEICQIPANWVRLVPAGVSMPGKPDKNRPATVHTVVPGRAAKQAPRPYNVYIRQPMKPTVSTKDWGLTTRVIENMAVHDDLPAMAAYDTFTANVDRHNNNFFYDAKTHHYFLIDLESCFRHNLAELAHAYIKNAVDIKQAFSSAQQHALLIYRDTLCMLAKRFPENVMIALFRTITNDARIEHYSDKSTFASNLAKYENTIRTNLASVRECIATLDQLAQQFTVKSNAPVMQILSEPWLLTCDCMFECISAYSEAINAFASPLNGANLCNFVSTESLW